MNPHLRLIKPPPSGPAILTSQFIHHCSLFVHYQRALRAAYFGTYLFNAAWATGDISWGASLGHLGGDLEGHLGGVQK